METIFTSADNKSELKMQCNYMETTPLKKLENFGIIDGFQIKNLVLSGEIKTIKPTLFIDPPIQIFGKTVRQRRSIGFFSNESLGYKYSGQFLPSQILPDWMQKILLSINNELNTNFNAILINYYINGNDYISAHSDDESCLSGGLVAVLSFGEERKFVIRDKFTKKIVYKTYLPNNSLTLMTGNFQQVFTHEIPKDSSYEPRYSLTFRYHKT